jgi:hypothetical protein
VGLQPPALEQTGLEQTGVGLQPPALEQTGNLEDPVVEQDDGKFKYK